MQQRLTFEIDWNLIKSTHLLKENIRLNAENQKLNFRLRAYRGWSTKRVKNSVNKINLQSK